MHGYGAMAGVVFWLVIFGIVLAERLGPLGGGPGAAADAPRGDRTGANSWIRSCCRRSWASLRRPTPGDRGGDGLAPSGTVKSHVLRGANQLRAWLSDTGQETP